jgi:hypothetical protein
MSISTKENKNFVSICDPIISKFGGQEFNIRKHNFMFFHHIKEHQLDITFFFKFKNHKFFYWFICVDYHFKNIQVISSSIPTEKYHFYIQLKDANDDGISKTWDVKKKYHIFQQ